MAPNINEKAAIKEKEINMKTAFKLSRRYKNPYLIRSNSDIIIKLKYLYAAELYLERVSGYQKKKERKVFFKEGIQ